jgi:galactokinase/mevalonate kinase-like predicted kinase
MSQSDFDNMSHKELADRIATMKDNIEAMKDELAKKTADEFEKILTEFWVKAEELGISPDRIIDAVKKSAARHAGKPSSRPQKLSKLSI